VVEADHLEPFNYSSMPFRKALREHRLAALYGSTVNPFGSDDCIRFTNFHSLECKTCYNLAHRLGRHEAGNMTHWSYLLLQPAHLQLAQSQGPPSHLVQVSLQLND